MNNLLLIDIKKNLSDKELFFNNKFIPDYISDISQKIEEITSIIFSIDENYTGKIKNYKNIFIKKDNEIECWKSFSGENQFDNVILIQGDSPFIDFSNIKEMLETHTKYLAEYTFSENLPAGYGCEIFSHNILKELPGSETITEENYNNSLSAFIKKNINQFDVELFYKTPDIRSKRINFLLSNRREKKIMENIFSIENKIPGYSDIKDIIDKHPEVLYVGPSYIEIELSTQADSETIYSYRKLLNKKTNHMDTGLLKKILSDMKNFDMPYSISLCGSGDPLANPDFYESVKIILKEDLVETLIIETDGAMADENFINFISTLNDKRIKIIFEMNGYNDETYKKIHQNNNFSKVNDLILKLKNQMGKNSQAIYVQVMKINETEDFLDNYYDYWEKQNINIILQKYNTYLNQLEDKKYYDLTPMDRMPCWHLQRDLSITASGDALFCKQDVNLKSSNWNINGNSIEEIWKLKKEKFIENYKGHLSTSPDCKICDEWYTFNL